MCGAVKRRRWSRRCPDPEARALHSPGPQRARRPPRTPRDRPGPLGTTQDPPERPGRRRNPPAPSAAGEAALPVRPDHSRKAGALPWAPRDRGGCGTRRGREHGAEWGPGTAGAVGTRSGPPRWIPLTPRPLCCPCPGQSRQWTGGESQLVDREFLPRSFEIGVGPLGRRGRGDTSAVIHRDNARGREPRQVARSSAMGEASSHPPPPPGLFNRPQAPLGKESWVKQEVCLEVVSCAEAPGLQPEQDTAA